VLPVVDMSPLRTSGAAGRAGVIAALAAACREHGFFYAVGHGVDQGLLDRLMAASRRFFALPEAVKLEIAMSRGGPAWRGYFPVFGELTSGAPDRKEGLYFGTELPADHPRVAAGVPLHGGNLFPAQVPELRALVPAYMAAVTAAAHVLIAAIGEGLGLPADYFSMHYTREPTVLFRIFNYPPGDGVDWGVGEHTDYGLLTLLAQDEVGGLQVKTPRGWIDAPPLAGSLVCNLGDMLDRLTGGWYRSTPHRVRNAGERARLAVPLFFDPDFAAEVVPLPRAATGLSDDAAERWDRASVHAFRGTYGEYLMSKVARVFPALAGAQPPTPRPSSMT
jgi:isopenicillin N synthase-like dioxygenase